MPKEVEALRSSLDSRLTALEKALADPGQHSLLESLILDLARVASEEAEATTREAVVAAQTAAQKVADAVRADAAKALEDEKAEAAALRHVIDEAKAALKQAESALKQERRAAETANREAAGAQRELAAIRESLEQEQSVRAAQSRELAVALAGVEAERARASAVEQQVAQAGAQAESARAALQGQIEQQRAALEGERAAAAHLRDTSSALERQLEATRGELEVIRHELDSARGERDAAQRNLDAGRRELEGARQDSDARARTLSHSQAEQEQALKSAQDAARSAEARLGEAIRDRDAIQQEAAKLKQQLEFAESAVRERDALKSELQAAHEAREAAEALGAARNAEPRAGLDTDSDAVADLASIAQEEERQLAIENRIRSLELALRDAETRAESAEVELDQLHRARRSSRSVDQVSERERPPEVTPMPAGSASEPEFRGPARAAKRVQFKVETEIQIDGTPGILVDLSLTGAQVLTPSAMKPNRLVTVTLPMGKAATACKAKVMWSRLEPRSGQLWYRAGVSFTSADQIAIEKFLKTHQK
jgi:hypothetical protein